MLFSFYRTLAGFSAANVVMRIKIKRAQKKLRSVSDRPAQVVASGMGLANEAVDSIGSGDQEGKKDSKIMKAGRPSTKG